MSRIAVPPAMQAFLRTKPKKELPPQMAEALRELGIPEPMPRVLAPHLVKYLAAGKPQRTAEEIRHFKESCASCDLHAELEDRCQSGQCSLRGLPLGPLRQMATWRCPEPLAPKLFNYWEPPAALSASGRTAPRSNP